jgi:hypothetical protein
MTRKFTAGLVPAALLMTLTTLPLAAQTARPTEGPDIAAEEEMTQQEMTQPSTLPGLTLTGELVSFDQEAIRVRTVTGVESLVLTDRTTKPADLAAGDKVAVDFTRSAQGAMIVSQVRKVSDAEMESADHGAMDHTMSGSEVMAQSGSTTQTAPAQGSTTGSSVDSMSSTGSTMNSTSSTAMDDTQVTADTTTYDADSDTLPSTGSDLPLAGLAGLLALGLAAGLRALVR